MKILAFILLTATSAFALTNDFTDRAVLVRPATATNSPVQLQQMTQAVAAAVATATNGQPANVLFFGAVGDGVTTDTVPVQAAFDSGAGSVYFPGSHNYLLGQITVTNGVRIYGDEAFFESGHGTRITALPGFSAVFSVYCLAPVTIENLGFTSALGFGTNGAAILVDSPGPYNGNLFSRVMNCVFDGMYDGVRFISGASPAVRESIFWNIPTNGHGIFLDNVVQKDQGDQSISGCTFHMTGSSNATGIAWQGGGGPRIVNNKFFGGYGININYGLTGSNATGQITIMGNGFDNIPGWAQAIAIFNTTGSSNFWGVGITGNNFESSQVLNTILIDGSPTARVSIVSIDGNWMYSYGTSYIGDGGISLRGVTNFNISGNVILGPGVGNGIILTNCGLGYIGANLISGWATNISTNNTSSTVHIGSNY